MQQTIFLSILFFAAGVLSQQNQQPAGSGRREVCRRPNGFFPHEQYCDYYYECVDGTPQLRECPNGLAFSGPGRGLLEHCDYPHQVNCPDPDNNRVLGQPPRGSGVCPYKYGIYPHERSCTRYWLCWNGTGTAQMCPFSLLYSESAHSCDWPERVPGCQQHPLCQGNPNGPTPVRGSCGRYWLCVGGYPLLQRCPAGLAFNADGLRCDWANNVPGCEPSPSPLDEEEEDETPPARRQHAPPRRAAATDDEKTHN